MRIFKGLARICVGLGMLVLAGSYLGAVHPLGDSLAMFRDWIAGGLAGVALFAVLVRAWRIGLIGFVVAGAAVLHIELAGILVTPRASEEGYLNVYSKNLGSGRTDWVALTADIALFTADVIVLQEVTQARMAELPDLLPDHPFQHICNFSGWSAMAVFSRYPLSDPGCTDHRSLAHAVVDAPSGPVWVASIHQVWPYPHEQAALLPDILDAVEAAPARRVVAGDFNMVPWGHSVQAIMEAGDMQRISLLRDTIEVRGVGFPIDHALTDGQGTTILRPRFGSDHHGLVARIVWGAR